LVEVEEVELLEGTLLGEEGLLEAGEVEEAAWTEVGEVEAGVVEASRPAVEVEVDTKAKEGGEEGRTLPCNACKRSRDPPTSSPPLTLQSVSSAAGPGSTLETLDLASQRTA